MQPRHTALTNKTADVIILWLFNVVVVALQNRFPRHREHLQSINGMRLNSTNDFNNTKYYIS